MLQNRSRKQAENRRVENKRDYSMFFLDKPFSPLMFSHDKVCKDLEGDGDF